MLAHINVVVVGGGEATSEIGALARLAIGGAREHGGELEAEARAGEEVEEKVGQIVQVEQEVSERREELVLDGVLELLLARMHGEHVLVVISYTQFGRKQNDI